MSNAYGGPGVSLNYRGTNAVQSPNWTYIDRDPTLYDSQNVSLGDLWLNTSTESVFVLVSLTGNAGSKGARLATWVEITTGGSGDLTEITSDSGTVIPSAGNVNILGGGNINTSGTSDTLTINLDNTVTISGSMTAASLTAESGNISAPSGTVSAEAVTATNNIISTAGSIISSVGNITATDGVLAAGTGITVASFDAGVVQSGATGDFSSTNGTNGQILIGGGTAPTWANITPGDGISITNGSNSISIAQGVSTTFPAFLAQLTSTQTDVTGDGTNYQVIFATTMFDQGSNFNTSTGVFTAPITGLYVFCSFITMGVTDASFTSMNYSLVTTARTYVSSIQNVGAMRSSANVCTVNFPGLLVKMTAGDTAYMTINIGGGTKTLSPVVGGSSAFFSGYLIR